MCLLDCLKKKNGYEHFNSYKSCDISVKILSFTPDYKICLEIDDYKFQMVQLFDFDLSQLYYEEIKTCNQLFSKSKVHVKWMDYPKSIIYPVRLCKINMEDGELLSSKLMSIFHK